MTNSYEVRTILWPTVRLGSESISRRWALFRDYKGISTCFFTAETRRQVVAHLRTAQHQRQLPKGAIVEKGSTS